MVYQEQVMQAAQVLAGYTLGGADMLRRAMGKKKPEEMAKQRAIFVAGAKKLNDIPEAKANQLFDVLDKFAGYGFNKAHAACYGVITCQTAWLKARHPVEFMAALLSNELDNTDKIAAFVAEAKAMGIAVLPPSVNESGSRFTVRGNSIRFGLSAIKNVGEAAVELIVQAREKDGPFLDLYDLCLRVETRAMNKKLVESLVKAGACDDFGPNRAELASHVDTALGEALARKRENDSNQIGLFTTAPGEKEKRVIKPNGVPEWPVRERLNFEKELLGFYVTGHPLDEYRADLQAFALHTIAQLKDSDGEIDTRVCGLIAKVEIRTTQKDKKPWARVTLEDLTGALEVLVFPDSYAGEIVVIAGQLDRREDQPKLRAAQVLSLPQAHEQLLRELVLHLPLQDWLETKRWAQLRELVMDEPGPVKLRLVCSRPAQKPVELAPADHYGVAWTPQFKARLESFLTTSHYELRASTQLPRPKRKPWQNRG
jgi:DNA polymerase-3 subunit alpha